MFLEPLEQGFGSLSQASEAEAAAQLGAQEPEGRVLGGLLEVLAVLLQPQADHWEQGAEEETNRRCG